MATDDTLRQLKSAFGANNLKQVSNIQSKLKLSLPKFIKETYQNSLKVDELAAYLMPYDFCLPDVFPVKTLGNGNCLYNSVSF